MIRNATLVPPAALRHCPFCLADLVLIEHDTTGTAYGFSDCVPTSGDAAVFG